MIEIKYTHGPNEGKVVSLPDVAALFQIGRGNAIKVSDLPPPETPEAPPPGETFKDKVVTKPARAARTKTSKTKKNKGQ